MRHLWLAGLIMLGVNATACLNGYDEQIDMLMIKGSPKDIAESVKSLQAEYDKKPSPELATDLAVAQILAGNYKAAIKILRKVERERPGVFKTAANLGTALELSGNNKEALVWIKEGVKRYPKDHQGSEWVHVRILEAKLAMEKDPAWLQKHHVLGVDMVAFPCTQSFIDHTGKPKTLDEVSKAISYQLKERLKFVTAPDPVVADLYMTWGDIEAVSGTGKGYYATDYYHAAQRFGTKDTVLKGRRVQCNASVSRQ